MSATSRTMSLVLAACLAATSLVGCATTDDTAKNKTRSERLASKKSRGEVPKHYGIYKQKDLDMQLLRRGQNARQSPSLDSY